MNLDPTGIVQACCDNRWFVLGDTATMTLKQIWRGERAEELRTSLVNGDLSKGCEMCSSAISQGERETALYHSFDSIQEHFSGLWPTQMELSLSNTCNLECTMCNGELSSAIRSRREGRPALPKVYGEDFFSQLDEFLPQLQVVKFLGGEPFLSRESLRVMDRLIELRLRPDCYVTTNGTQWNERIRNYASQLPMSIVVSLDAHTKKTYDSIRIGSNFELVHENIFRYESAVLKSGGTVSLTYCLMSDNWHELGDFLLWADTRQLDVTVNKLVHPAGMSLYHLAAEELAVVVATLLEEDMTLRTALTRNLQAWTHQLSELVQTQERRQIVTGSRVVISRAAQSLPPSGPEDSAPADTTIAIVTTSPSGLIDGIWPDASNVAGVDLRQILLQPIIQLRERLIGSFGNVVSTSLAWGIDGEEHRTVTLQRDSIRSVFTIIATPLTGGRQQWSLSLEKETAVSKTDDNTGRTAT